MYMQVIKFPTYYNVRCNNNNTITIDNFKVTIRGQRIVLRVLMTCN